MDLGTVRQKLEAGRYAVADELAAAGAMGQRGRTHVLSALVMRSPDLARGDAYWDDVATEGVLEGRADAVVAAMNTAGDRLAALLGDDPSGWLWGRIHTLTFVANLFDDAGVGDFNFGPFANDGGMDTVDVAAPRSASSDGLIWAATSPFAAASCIRLPHFARQSCIV